MCRAQEDLVIPPCKRPHSFGRLPSKKGRFCPSKMVGYEPTELCCCAVPNGLDSTLCDVTNEGMLMVEDCEKVLTRLVSSAMKL